MEFQILPPDYHFPSRISLASDLRRGGWIDPKITSHWWRWIALKITPNGTLEWYENDTLQGRYEASDIESFDQHFENAYRTVKTDTNIRLISEIQVSPVRPYGEIIHLLDRLNRIEGREVRRVVTEYRREPVLSMQIIHYLDLLDRQYRTLRARTPALIPLLICGTGQYHKDSLFQKQPLYGKKFEQVLDLLNPLPPIKVQH
jgi:hypothetical protein